MTDIEKIAFLNKLGNKKQAVFDVIHINENKTDTVTIGDIVDLINHQQAEIEEMHKRIVYLDEDREGWSRTATTQRLKNIELQAEIERLLQKLQQPQTEAIKEFVNSATDLCYKEFGSELEIAHTFAAILTRTLDNFEKRNGG